MFLTEHLRNIRIGLSGLGVPKLELKEFIAETLQQIIDGVRIAQSGEMGANVNADMAGAGDWFAFIDGTDTDAVAQAIAGRFDKALADTSSRIIASGTYRLMWDLAKRDL